MFKASKEKYYILPREYGPGVHILLYNIDLAIEFGLAVHILWGFILYMCYIIWTPYRKRTPGCVVDIIYF